jgi:hypothetical protein
MTYRHFEQHVNDETAPRLLGFNLRFLNPFHRIKMSPHLGKFLGDGLTLEELDAAINSLALVNALIITVPFNIFQCFGQGTFYHIYLS